MPRGLSKKTLQAHAREWLIDQITTGVWKPRQSLPNEGELARELGVSIGTMRKALDELASARLVQRWQGRGTFIVDQSTEEARARFSNLRLPNGTRVSGEIRSLGVTTNAATATERACLELSTSDEVHHARRVRTHQGTPFMVEDVCWPATLFSHCDAQAMAASGMAPVAQTKGLLVGHWHESVSVVSASAVAVNELGVGEGTSLLELDRVVRTIDGRVLEWRVGETNLAGRLRYTVEMD